MADRKNEIHILHATIEESTNGFRTDPDDSSIVGAYYTQESGDTQGFIKTLTTTVATTVDGSLTFVPNESTYMYLGSKPGDTIFDIYIYLYKSGSKWYYKEYWDGGLDCSGIRSNAGVTSDMRSNTSTDHAWRKLGVTVKNVGGTNFYITGIYSYDTNKKKQTIKIPAIDWKNTDDPNINLMEEDMPENIFKDTVVKGLFSSVYADEEEQTADNTTPMSSYKAGESNGMHIVSASGFYSNSTENKYRIGEETETRSTVKDRVLGSLITDEGEAEFNGSYGSFILDQENKFNLFIRLEKKGNKVYYEEYYRNYGTEKTRAPKDCAYIGEYNTYVNIEGIRYTGYRVNYVNSAFITKPELTNGELYSNPECESSIGGSNSYLDGTGGYSRQIGGTTITGDGGVLITNVGGNLPVYTDSKSASGAVGLPVKVAIGADTGVEGVTSDPYAATATVEATSGATVYSIPSTGGSVMGTFASSDKITLVYKCSNGWYGCETWNGNGYVDGQYLNNFEEVFPSPINCRISAPFGIPLAKEPKPESRYDGLYFVSNDIVYGVTSVIRRKDPKSNLMYNWLRFEYNGGPAFIQSNLIYEGKSTSYVHNADTGEVLLDFKTAAGNGIGVGGMTYGVYPSMVMSAAELFNKGQSIPESHARKKIPNGAQLQLITILELWKHNWALCIYEGEYVYVLVERLDLRNAVDKMPQKSISYTGQVMNNVTISYPPISTINCDAHIVTRDTWMMSPMQALMNSCEKASRGSIAERQSEARWFVLKKGSLVGILRNELYGELFPTYENLGPSSTQYLVACAYNTALGMNTYGYVVRDALIRYDDRAVRKNAINETNEQIKENPEVSRITDVYHSATVLTTEKSFGLISSTSMGDRNDDFGPTGVLEEDQDNGYVSVVLTVGTEYHAVAREKIRDVDWAIVYMDGIPEFFYISYADIEEDWKKATERDFADYHWIEDMVKNLEEQKYATREDLVGNVDGTEYSETVHTVDLGHRGNANYEWYDVTLPAGTYPDEDTYNRDGMGLKWLPKGPDEMLPSDWSFPELLDSTLNYNLARYTNKYLSFKKGGSFDSRQINRINRFRYITDMDGMGTKSFIFMTRPDLNLYETTGQMTEDAKRLAPFKYIGRNKDVGYAITSSLEYFGTNDMATPWLSVITNQATGYNPIDREIAYTEVGETFHGNKVLYGKHDFKHNYAGTIAIPFRERRDLSLYYTIKLWTEYIHSINLGLIEPRESHIINHELDYAVSLYYIQTLEDMQEIIYWEKLTGLFPLKCPDSFFGWAGEGGSKDMTHEIEFAYSMRHVLDTNDLYELDHLYAVNSQATGELVYPNNESMVADPLNSMQLAHMAAYFHMGFKEDDSTDEFGQPLYDPNKYKEAAGEVGSETYNAFVMSLINDADKLKNYYYEPYTDIYGKNTYFLANWLPKIQSPGIPYVVGPFVVPHKDYNGGKMLLKWV